MACLKSSVAAQSRTNIPVASDRVSSVDVAKLAPLPRRCSRFYRAIGLIDELLRLSPYGDFVFAAPAAAHGLSRPREQRMVARSRGQGCHSS